MSLRALRFLHAFLGDLWGHLDILGQIYWGSDLKVRA